MAPRFIFYQILYICHPKRNYMKKIVLALLLLTLVIISINAQVRTQISFTSNVNFSTEDRMTMNHKEEFRVDSVIYDPKYKADRAAFTKPTYLIGLTHVKSGKTIRVNARSLPKNFKLKPVDDNLQNYWFARNLESLRFISEIHKLYEIRSEIEADANKYIDLLYENNLVFEDPFLETYLYSVVSKFAPDKRADGFPYDIRVIIVKDPSINAYIYPNGTMVVNTGLLATVHTEDELVAVLSHEVAHFVANHTLVNIQKIEKAKARAEFWAGFATLLAAGAEVAAASNGYYTYGGITAGTAILSYSIASQVIERLGMEYTKEQEKEADLMALEVLKYLGYDVNAAATLFNRMTETYNKEGNWAAYYLSGDHPSLKERIEYSGKPYSRIDPEFEKKISFAVTDAAITKYRHGRFTQAMELVDQNINNRVGTDDDYLIKALCLLYLFNDDAHNKEAIAMIQQAKAINAGNANIFRTEIIASLRINDLSTASKLLESYKEKITGELNDALKDTPNYRFLSGELDWIRKMAVKVKGL